MQHKDIRDYKVPKVSIKDLFKDDFKRVEEMYQSPIEVICSQVRTQIVEEEERQILKAVHEVGVDVDREELIKALKYDRHQYKKGFEDGKKSVWVDVNERLPEKNGSYLVMISEFGISYHLMIASFANNLRIWTLDAGENRPGFHLREEEIKNVVAWLEIPPYRE